MAQNKSLSTQEVADILHVSKSTIYELIRRGEINSYKVGRKVRFTQDDVDAYIARSRHEQSVQPVRRVEISSELLSPAAASERPFVISGQDVVLDILSNYLHQSGIHADRCYLSSFEGLLALYEGKVDAAACHLYAVDEKSFNVPYVRRLMPGVKALDTSGHTPGHVSFLLKSGKDKLLVIGDLIHFSRIQLPLPEVAVKYDVDPAKAVQARKRIFDYACEKRIPMAGMHVPFPGMLKLKKAGAGYEEY